MSCWSFHRSPAARHAVMGMLLILPLVGCEREPPAPPPAPPVQADPAPVARAAIPTTQQVLDAPWKTVPVSLLPLTISVPEAWDVEPTHDASLLAVEGRSPGGFVQMRVSKPRTMIAEASFDSFITAARRSAEESGDRLKKLEFKPGDPLSTLERQIAGERELMPLMDEQGNLIEKEATPLRWSVLIFLKSGDKYESYELQFDALSLEHYEQDQAILRRVVESLAYDSSRRQ